MARHWPWMLLAASFVLCATLLFVRLNESRAMAHVAAGTQSAATIPQISAKPLVKDFKAGMIVDGAVVLSTADLVIDWKKWRGRPVIIRGRAFNPSDTSVAFKSANVLFTLKRIDSETHRWFLKECLNGLQTPECNVTIMGIPEDGQFGKELASVVVMR